MKQIGEIMEDIRDMPVCPQSGEINLYCIIQKHIEDGIFQSNSENDMETTNKQEILFPNWNPQKKTISMFSNTSERVRYKALRNSSSAFIKRKDVRNAVFKKDKYKCQICGSSEQLEVDHINSVYSVLKGRYPISKLNALENLRTLCKSCNSRKAP